MRIKLKLYFSQSKYIRIFIVMDWRRIEFCLIWIFCVSNSLSQELNKTIDKVPQCVKGQRIPPLDDCNSCICFEGQIHCSHVYCSSKNSTDSLSMETETLQPRCEEGNYIPLPPRPDDCNTCLCLNHRVLCTKDVCNTAEVAVKDIKGKKKNEEYDRKAFEKQIPVVPLINMLSINLDKITKLIHTHAYNGFHQEIKVHSKHMNKDTSKLLKTLATLLDNPVLADVGDKIKSSPSEYLSDNKEQEDEIISIIPFNEGNVLPQKSLDSSEINISHSSKLITIGSQSNETILVISGSESSDGQTSSVLPVSNQEKNCDSVVLPTPIVHNHQIYPFSTDEEKLLDYYSDNLPITIPSVQNPSQFGPPGLHGSPSRITEDIPDPINKVHPVTSKPINIDGAKIPYERFHQYDKEYKPYPSTLISKRGKFNEIIPDQHIKPTLRPSIDQSLINSDKIGIKHVPHKSPFEPNPSLYYPNQFNTSQQFKPDYLPTLNKDSLNNYPESRIQPNLTKGVFDKYPNIQINPDHTKSSLNNFPQFQNNPNQTTTTYHHNYKPPQFGMNSDQESIIFPNKLDQNRHLPHFNKSGLYYFPKFQINSNQTTTTYHTNLYQPSHFGIKPDQVSINFPNKQGPPFKSNPISHKGNPPQFGSIPNLEKRSGFADNEETKQKPPHSKIDPNPSLYPGGNIIFLQQNGFKSMQNQNKPDSMITHISHLTQPNPSPVEPNLLIYYSDRNKSLEIEPKSDQDEHQNSSFFYNRTEEYSQSHTVVNPDKKTRIPTPHTLSKRFNSSNSHYDSHSSTTFISEYDPFEADALTDQDDRKPNPNNNAPHTAIINQHNSADDYKPDEVLNETDLILSKINKYLNPQNPSRIVTNHKQKENKSSLVEPKISEANKSNQYGPHAQYSKIKFNKYTLPLNKYPHSDDQYKTDKLNPTHPSQSAKEFQYEADSNEDPNISQINQHKTPKLNFQQNQLKRGQNHLQTWVYDDHAPPKGNLKINQHLQSPFNLPHNPHKGGVLDDPLSTDGFQYPLGPFQDLINQKVNQLKPRHLQINFPKNFIKPGQDPSKPWINDHGFPIKPSPDHLKLGVFDDRGSADEFQTSSNLAEDLKNPKLNYFKLPHNEIKPAQDHPKPWVLDDHGSPNILQPLHNSPHPQLGFPRNQHKTEEPYAGNVDQFKPLQNQPISGLFDSSSSHPPTQQFNPQDYHKLGVFDDRGSADGSQYTNELKLPNSQSKDSLKQPQSWSVDDHEIIDSIDSVDEASKLKTSNPPTYISKTTYKMYNNQNYRRPRPIRLDQVQYKLSLFDNLHNGVHNIPWTLPDTQKKVNDPDASLGKNRLKPDHDQYRLSSFNNLHNGVHNISWILPDNFKKVPDTDASLTKNRLKPEQDQYKPSSVVNINNRFHQIPLSEENMNIVFSPDADFSTPQPQFKPNQDQYTLSIDPSWSKPKQNRQPNDNKSTSAEDLKDDNENNDQHSSFDLHLKAAKKISKPDPTDNPKFVGGDDQQFELHVFPIFTKIINSTPDDPYLSAKSQPKHPKSPIENEEILDWSKLTQYENLPLYTEVPNVSKNNLYQILPVLHPDVQIILHQKNDANDEGIPQYVENSEVIPEDLGAYFLQKILNPRYRYKSKDQKDECGEGTEWISKCHGCSCRSGRAICFKIPGCKLRPFDEPMICKPYTQFKMGDCYSCECNGDGVSECDATDCKTEELSNEEVQNRGLTEIAFPVFREYFDKKKTKELLQYCKFNKKLPKDRPSQKYPTCEPGTEWVSNCHRCQCNENGRHECTLLDNCELDFESYGMPARCKPNSKFYPKSNNMPCVECTCDDEGNPHCPSGDDKKH